MPIKNTLGVPVAVNNVPGIIEPNKSKTHLICPLNILSNKKFPVGKNNSTGFAKQSNSNCFKQIYLNWNL